MRRLLRVRSLLVVLLAGCTLAQRGAAGDRPPRQVYLVIVDGLAPRLATPEHMPRLAAATAAGGGSRLLAQGSMPARTNPNHASLLTAAEPDAHGITGNWWWDGAAVREMDDPALLEMETLFTAAARRRPPLRTLAVFGKGKLRRLFGALPGRQAGPGVRWEPAAPAAYAAADAEAMGAFRTLTARERPAFAVLAMADVDGAGHRYGPDSRQYAAAVAHADALVGALLDDLVRDGRWAHAVVLVTTDHGFDALPPPPAGRIASDTLAAPGAVVVSDGGVAHVYRRGELRPGAPDPIAAVAARARARPGVARIYAPGGDAAAPAPPAGWHLRHRRSGDLLLVARPGQTFVGEPEDPTRGFRGNHGAPGERAIPLFVTGGDPCLAPAPAGVRPRLSDVGATIAWLLGLDSPRALDGTPPPGAAGRAVEALLAPRCRE